MDRTEAFRRFKGEYPLRRSRLTDGTVWNYLDCGRKSSGTTLLCLPTTSGSCYSFFLQVETLTSRGYRVLCLSLPVVWTHEGFCKSLDLFMHEVKAQSAHIYGCGLGGFLAQAFAMEYPRRVESLALTNTFCDTRSFAEHSQLFSWSFAIAPEFLLKQYLLDKFPKDESDVAVVNAIDFQAAVVKSLTQEELASRLTLCTTVGASKRLRQAGTLELAQEKITFIDSINDVSVPNFLREQLYILYKNAKKAFLKSGGDFPYLSRFDQLNLHLMVHLRNNTAADGIPDPS